MTKKKYLSEGTCISLMIGTVVGIGIFLKNGTVFRILKGNPYSILISWFFIVVLCLAISITYIRICVDNCSSSGLGKWTENICGKKFGKKVSAFFIFFYGPLTPIVFALFAGEILMIILDKTKLTTNLMKDGYGKFSSLIIIFAITIILRLLFLWMNHWCKNLCNRISEITVIIKFIPLFVIAIFSIIFFFANGMKGSLFESGAKFSSGASGTQADAQNAWNQIDFKLILTALPGIIFTCDTFLNVGIFAPRIKNLKKGFPRIILTGMAIISICYLFVTFGQVLTSKVPSWGVFDKEGMKILGFGETAAKKAADIVEIVFYSIIFISLIGALNGSGLGNTEMTVASFEKDTICFSRYLKKKTNNNLVFGVFLWELAIFFFWMLIFLVPSFITNSDIYIDGISNFPALFFFLIYSILPITLSYQLLFKEKKRTWNNIMYTMLSVFVLFGCVTILFYQLFFVFLLKGIQNPTVEFKEWGGFIETKSSFKSYNWIVSLVFFAVVWIFLKFPIWNEKILKMETLINEEKIKRKRYDLIIKRIENYQRIIN